MVDRCRRRIAEQCHSCVLSQRQCAILVAQQHAALGLALDEICLLGLQHLILGGIIGLKIGGVVCTGNDRRAGIQEQIHITLTGKRQLGAKACQAQKQRQCCRQPPPQIHTLHCVPSPLEKRC